MKKVASIAAIALFAIGFTSCKKDYSCECSVNGTVVYTATIKDTKKNAETACNYTSTVPGATATCELK